MPNHFAETTPYDNACEMFFTGLNVCAGTSDSMGRHRQGRCPWAPA